METKMKELLEQKLKEIQVKVGIFDNEMNEMLNLLYEEEDNRVLKQGKKRDRDVMNAISEIEYFTCDVICSCQEMVEKVNQILDKKE